MIGDAPLGRHRVTDGAVLYLPPGSPELRIPWAAEAGGVELRLPDHPALPAGLLAPLLLWRLRRSVAAEVELHLRLAEELTAERRRRALATRRPQLLRDIADTLEEDGAEELREAGRRLRSGEARPGCVRGAAPPPVIPVRASEVTCPGCAEGRGEG